MCGYLIHAVNGVLINRKQRVVLNGQCLSWVDIWTGETQGSILEHRLVLIHVNDLSNDHKVECKLFADETLFP